jgi:hypothetical protein
MAFCKKDKARQSRGIRSITSASLTALGARRLAALNGDRAEPDGRRRSPHYERIVFAERELALGELGLAGAKVVFGSR